MGINHGGRGGVSPKFGLGDAIANCPPDFVTFQNFTGQFVRITMQKKCTVLKRNFIYLLKSYNLHIIH